VLSMVSTSWSGCWRSGYGAGASCDGLQAAGR
jgi:hypothetical protein